MSNSIFTLNFFKNIIKSINKLLEKNLNKLNSDNLTDLIKSNKIFVSFVALIILFLSYLFLPNVYNQSKVVKRLNNELSNKFNLDLKFKNKLDYRFFPRPHFTTENALIIYDQAEISKIKNLKIYISLENLFSSKSMKINKMVLDSASFNLNKENQNFFINLLDNHYLNSTLRITDSNIFFRNKEREVLFINKILDMRYFYDQNELKNIVYSENELFNIPYSIELYNDIEQKKIISKLNVKIFRLQIKNQFSYEKEIKSGIANLIFDNMKSILTYKKDKDFFEFNYADKKINQKFFYNGELHFKPFHSSFKGEADELNLFYLFNQNGIVSQLLKTELLNKKNLNSKFSINAKKIFNYGSFVNIFLNFKIQEGLLDIDKTEFSWKNHADFRLFDTLIYIKDGELILDANAQINIINNDEIYKFLLTPKKYRKKLKKINLNFTYNFDQKIIDITNIRINDKTNQKIREILTNINIKNDDLQNKIYFKNLLNKAIKNYSG